MSAETKCEGYREEILEFLKETFEDVRGLYLDRGSSLFETLDALTAEEASDRAGGASWSIAARVEHVRFFLQVCDDSIRLKKTGKVDWDESWSVQEVTSDEWNQLKSELRSAYERLVTMLEALEEWNGPDEVSDSMSILAHTAYHLGGIRQSLAQRR